MPRFNSMYPSPYLKADDCADGDLVLTIASVVQEDIGQGRDRVPKWVVRFQEDERGLVLNKTNATTIVRILDSDDTEYWVGKKITLFATEVQFQNEMVPALRIRLPRRGRTTPAKQSPTPATTADTAHVPVSEEELDATSGADIPF